MKRIQIHFWPCNSQSVEAKDPCLEWGALEPLGHKCSPTSTALQGAQPLPAMLGHLRLKKPPDPMGLRSWGGHGAQ